MAGLLVSVRSVTEARVALAGGAVIIDVKEPASGSLGRASEETITQVIRYASKYVPVSAAFGELLDFRQPFPPAGLTYAKWGLAGCRRRPDWQQELLQIRSRIEALCSCRLVSVAYADAVRADAPCVDEVRAFVCRHRLAVLLIDTWLKDGTTLLDWMSMDKVNDLCRRCRGRGIRVALAGSLGLREIEQLQEAEPAWFAVRGAACRGNSRSSSIDREAVQRLVECVTARVTTSAEN